MPPPVASPAALTRVLLLAGLLALTACGREGAGEPEEAADRWLAALAGAEEDRGLSMLGGFATEGPDGPPDDDYVAAAAAADWDAAGLRVSTVRPLSSGTFSVTVLADGPIPPLFADFALAAPVCDGDEVAGLRFEMFSGDGGTFIAPRWDGLMLDGWRCDRPEFTPGEPAAHGDGLSLMNNSELPVSVRNALERDIIVPPCTTVTFRDFLGPLTLTTSQGSLGTTNGSEDPDVGTRFIVVGDREIYDELAPPLDPWPQCGGEPPVAGS